MRKQGSFRYTCNEACTHPLHESAVATGRYQYIQINFEWQQISFCKLFPNARARRSAKGESKVLIQPIADLQAERLSSTDIHAERLITTRCGRSVGRSKLQQRERICNLLFQTANGSTRKVLSSDTSIIAIMPASPPTLTAKSKMNISSWYVTTFSLGVGPVVT